jgi:hypothetical protein
LRFGARGAGRRGGVCAEETLPAKLVAPARIACPQIPVITNLADEGYRGS